MRKFNIAQNNRDEQLEIRPFGATGRVPNRFRPLLPHYAATVFSVVTVLLLFAELVRLLSCNSGVFGCGYQSLGLIIPFYLVASELFVRISLPLYVGFYVLSSLAFVYLAFHAGLLVERMFSLLMHSFSKLKPPQLWRRGMVAELES